MRLRFFSLKINEIRSLVPLFIAPPRTRPKMESNALRKIEKALYADGIQVVDSDSAYKNPLGKLWPAFSANR